MVIVVGILTLVFGGAVTAAPDGSAVSGVIDLPDPASLPKLPVRSQGFTRRIRGPLKPPKKLDVRDEIIVVLTGGPVADDDKKPSGNTLRYEIVGESFATPVFPFVVGSKVEIKNGGHNTPQLYSPGRDDLIEGTPLAAKAKHPIRGDLTEPYKAVDIKARDSAHLRGRLVPIPHAYFSLVDDRGRYEIKGVPAGTWTVKVWYRDGWIQGAESKVEVSGTKTKASTIKLPADVNTKPAAEAD